MPMIDVYAAAGTFDGTHELARDLARAVMRWEGVPDIPLFADNTAAFIHHLPADAMSDATGASNHVRVQVLTPAGVLDREKQLGVVKDLARAYTTDGIEGADARLLDAAVGLFDTEDARGGIRAFLASGPGRATFGGH